MKIQLFLVLILGFAAVVITSCDSETIVDPGADKVYAKAGSTYDFKGYKKDSSYNKVSGSDTTWRDSVSSGPATFDGRTNVVTVLRGNGDTTVFNYEENGDISLYLPRGIDEEDFPIKGLGTGWWRIPFGSKKINDTLFVKDTAAIIQSGVASVNFRVTASYVGSSTLVLSSESLVTEQAKLNIAITIDAGIFKFTVTNEIIVDFAAKVGYLVRQDSKQTQPPLGGKNEGGIHEELTAYSLVK